MMLFDPRWTKPLGLALSLPSTIIAAAYGSMKLVQENYIPRWLGIVIFIAVVSNILFLMVYYGFKNRN